MGCVPMWGCCPQNPGYARRQELSDGVCTDVGLLPDGVCTDVGLLSPEPGLRRAPGAAGEPEDQLPDGGDDGPRPRHHHPREARQLRLPGERRPFEEVLHPLQAVRGTAQQTGQRTIM